MPERTSLSIVTRRPLRSAKGVAVLLDAFERVDKLAPTNWGLDERARNPYDREQVISAVSALKTEFRVPGLHRRKPPRYEAYFSARDVGFKDVYAEFGTSLSQRDLPAVFEMGDALAEALEADFGNVHVVWEDSSDAYAASGKISAEEFQRYGPTPVCARTWFGPHLVQLIGRERLLNTGLQARETSWGAVRLDLVDPPWLADGAVLTGRQTEVMERLAPSGVFGDYRDYPDYKPGPRWVPPPDEPSHSSE